MADSPPVFQAPKGTRDILPPESRRWEDLVALFGDFSQRAGFDLVITPIFEDLGVFVRGVGEETDVVGKEMYDFADKGGRQLALRPEMTASVMRAFIEHHPALPWKVWYWGPQFRQENPQAGRYRQFFQLGVEALGSADAEMDVEVVTLAWDFCLALGLTGLDLGLNSLGDATCRPIYRAALLAYLEPLASQLCPEHRSRWRERPLRVLDCKRPECVAATAAAPTPVEYLCQDCAAHFGEVQSGLSDLGVPWRLAPRLVRGLDYYTRTTFEIAAPQLQAAQNTVGGGGRYDGLAQSLGGPPTPGIGFSLGLERLLLALPQEEASDHRNLAVFVVDLVGGRQATLIASELRRAGIRADRAFDSRSLRAQLRAADKSGAQLAVIVGAEELEGNTATVRNLADGTQEKVERDKLAARVAQMLAER